MVTWLTGNTGAGKTTLAKQLASKTFNSIVLDGDELRVVWQDKTLTKEDRWEHNLRVARLASLLSSQGFNVFVAVICPYDTLRQEVRQISNCTFIYIPYGVESTEKTPYEIPNDAELIYSRRAK